MKLSIIETYFKIIGKELFFFLVVISMISCSSEPNTKHISPSSSSNQTWLGRWQRHEWANSAVLQISKVKTDTFYFALEATNGGNTGDIEGTSVIINNQARFVTDEEDENCIITFELIGDSIIKVEQVSGNCLTGIGVSYSGLYQNSEKVPPIVEKTPNLIDLGIFQNEMEDKAFRDLTGDDYSLFVISSQLTSEDEDIDSFNAKVHSSGVRGLFTSMENIIMITEQNRIWAAVIDDKKVYYFTNDKKYKNTLPKTIDNWRENFKDYEIIYK